MNEPFDRRVHEADGHKKIFENRVKYIVFFLAVAVGIATLWDKCFPSHKADADITAQKPADSVSTPAKSHQHSETTSVPHKRHSPKVITKPDTNEANTPKTEKPVPAVTTSLQTANSDNIEFKLMKATESIGAQAITMTIALTTDKATWYILSYVKSIIDPDGNEYKYKSFTNGASTWNTRINLVTGILIKCTYTFGGVPFGVKTVRLFKYDYMHQWGQPFYVEFRDVPVEWK